MNINFRTFGLSIDDRPFQSETANDSTTNITSADATATRKQQKCEPSKRVLICLCGHYSLLTIVTEKIINTADYTSYSVFISCLKTAPYSLFISDCAPTQNEVFPFGTLGNRLGDHLVNQGLRSELQV